MINEEIRTLMHNYSRMHQPGHYSDTEFDCLQDVIAFVRECIKQDRAAASGAAVRTDDFAKIVRGTSGQQVLFYLEDSNEDGNTLHCVANYEGMQADIKFGGIPDEDFNGALGKADIKMADQVLALLGRGRGGLLGGDDGGCASPGGVSPGQAAILQTLLEGQSSLRAEVPTTALETQAALQQAISALALGGQQGFANVKDAVQNSLLANLTATTAVKDTVQNTGTLLARDICDTKATVMAEGCATRELVQAGTTAILSRIDRAEIDELRAGRDRFERQTEINALRATVDVNQSVNVTNAANAQQSQSQAQWADVNNRLARLFDRVDIVHQEQRSTNANIIAGNTGAVVTGPQTSTPTAVNAR